MSVGGVFPFQLCAYLDDVGIFRRHTGIAFKVTAAAGCDLGRRGCHLQPVIFKSFDLAYCSE